MRRRYIIHDWAGNEMFNGKEFRTFEDAEDYLLQYLGDNYDDSRGEYYILKTGGKK